MSLMREEKGQRDCFGYVHLHDSLELLHGVEDLPPLHPQPPLQGQEQGQEGGGGGARGQGGVRAGGGGGGGGGVSGGS